jgi:hypothetical protein
MGASSDKDNSHWESWDDKNWQKMFGKNFQIIRKQRKNPSPNKSCITQIP